MRKTCAGFEPFQRVAPESPKKALPAGSLILRKELGLGAVYKGDGVVLSVMPAEAGIQRARTGASDDLFAPL